MFSGSYCYMNYYIHITWFELLLRCIFIHILLHVYTLPFLHWRIHSFIVIELASSFVIFFPYLCFKAVCILTMKGIHLKYLKIESCNEHWIKADINWHFLLYSRLSSTNPIIVCFGLFFYARKSYDNWMEKNQFIITHLLKQTRVQYVFFENKCFKTILWIHIISCGDILMRFPTINQ